MMTIWGETLDIDNILQEYPRPQLVRDSYMNLNGPWFYAITKSDVMPEGYTGVIVVPFSPECELSTVNRVLWPDEYLWYMREFTLPEGFNRGRVLLNFGAVDQMAEVFVNGVSVGSHTGGYTAFTLDISEALLPDVNTLAVRVRDTTDTSWHSRGKQRTKRGGIWYTAQSGIWQTVWMESVPEEYVHSVRLKPRVKSSELEVTVYTTRGVPCTAEIAGETHQLEANRPTRIPISGYKLWSPEDPALYPVVLTAGEDRVDCYFAMRKVEVKKDEDGIPRIFLNGEPYFMNGLLDQGYWPDGLYTAPSDEALLFDIRTAKEMGFNTLRKHIKVEPARFYYHCDRLGMLVWQDMPSGGGKYNKLVITAPLMTGVHMSDCRDGNHILFARQSTEGRLQYIRELKEMVKQLENCPCIVMWVPFNEGWGQFDSMNICEEIREIDGSRLIDHASGWHDQGISDVQSLHVYFKKYSFSPDKRGRAVVLSEFGGYGNRVPGHAWGTAYMGYRKCATPLEYETALRELYAEQILPAEAFGLSAAIYTQLTDVEDEQNGFLTYDRKVIKLPPETIKNIIWKSEI